MLFYELLQVAIGNRNELSHTPASEEWRELYHLALRQALVGIAFRGVEQLPEHQRPPKTLLMQWYVAAERIKVMNSDLDRKALAVANKFLEEGFRSVILKGQGVAKLYQVSQIGNGQLTIDNGHPEGEFSTLNSQFSISNYRTPGDIDIWLEGGREKILDYVRRYVPDCRVVYHHVDFPVVDGLDVEVHFFPSWLNSPITNRRLQRFFHRCAEGFFVESSSVLTELPCPNLAFNRVYILLHIYHHLFYEGIGLRQLMDYYFVLYQGFSEDECAETMRVLRSLKMERFAAAVMWVLQKVFGMDDSYLITAPNEREGRFLLNEIMLAGNFGKYDERLQHERGESSIHWALRKIKRNFRFVRSYPSEVLWSPLWKIWHWCWRKSKGYL